MTTKTTTKLKKEKTKSALTAAKVDTALGKVKKAEEKKAKMDKGVGKEKEKEGSGGSASVMTTVGGLLSPGSSASPEVEDVDLVKMMYEIAKGMEYLHSKGVLHGDLKVSAGEQLVVRTDWR